MKISLPQILCAASVLLLSAFLLPLGAQNTANSSDDLLPLIETIAAQQKQIDANQTLIDQNLASIQESLRQAKIYINRAGGTKSTK
jgi:hypothetical protein